MQYEVTHIPYSVTDITYSITNAFPNVFNIVNETSSLRALCLSDGPPKVKIIGPGDLGPWGFLSGEECGELSLILSDIRDPKCMG